MILNRMEESYLEHILVAAGVQDYSAPFRTFFDNWFAFKEGGPFLNGNSRPHWYNNPCPDKHGEALRRAHFVSTAAAQTLAGLARERLMKDHAIPVAVLRDMLFDEQPNAIELIRSFMLRYYRFGIITEGEDHRLNEAGLRSRMPPDWAKDDSPFSRYDDVGIVAQDQGKIVPTTNRTLPEQSDISRPQKPIAGLLSSTTSNPLWKGRRNV